MRAPRPGERVVQENALKPRDRLWPWMSQLSQQGVFKMTKVLSVNDRAKVWEIKKVGIDYFSWTVLFSDSLHYNWWTITLQLRKQIKLSILLYRSISQVGIVQIWWLPYLLNHPTNNSTMVSRLPLRRHGFGKSIHPTPSCLFGKGRSRSQ